MTYVRSVVTRNQQWSFYGPLNRQRKLEESMYDSSVKAYAPGEQEFMHYHATLGPNDVIYPSTARSGQRRFGVTVHRSALQWEIVAVEAGRTRHVAFVSTLYCLEQVLSLASDLGRESIPLSQ